MRKNEAVKLTAAALMLAAGLVLPFVTGQIPEVGSMLLPMHLPALLCGFVCGWPWGLAVGFVLPILRSLLFGMPPMVPTALCMAVELAAYGAVAGLLYQKLPSRPWRVYVALVGAMLLGRAAWGLASAVVYRLLTPNVFTLTAFWMSGFVGAWPGMVLQVLLVPAVVYALERAKVLPLGGK